MLSRMLRLSPTSLAFILLLGGPLACQSDEPSSLAAASSKATSTPSASGSASVRAAPIPSAEPTIEGEPRRGDPLTPPVVPEQIGIDKRAIQGAIRANLKTIRRCYEDQLGKDPNLAGRVKLLIVIGKTGRVTSTKVEEGIHPDVDACLQRVVSAIAFPKPAGGGEVRVSYPFVFKAAD
jgi:Gram-negative bacterial TonB protein C-terminal